MKINPQRLLFYVLCTCVVAAVLTGCFEASVFWIIKFLASSISLMILSIYLGDMTENLAYWVGEKYAALIYVTFGNITEAIIISSTVKAGLIDVVQGNIIGSIIGNLLLVNGASIYFGCRRHGTLTFNSETGEALVQQLLFIGTVLFLPTLFADHIQKVNMQYLSYVQAVVLIGMYVYYFFASGKSKRIANHATQHTLLQNPWPLWKILVVLAVCSFTTWGMSELLVSSIKPMTTVFHLSEKFMGFMMMPLLGNITEHLAAIRMARRNLTELSLGISVGSASQVGMIIAPWAVICGFVTGHPVTLFFPGLPLGILVISVVHSYFVLRDNRLTKNEGITQLALYCLLFVGFLLT
ncbi:MAG: hypothetical protein PHY34_04690 [Patescibacteria group bacterium]|nr:hypothetical protein [Patescibacteria group bacterium]